VRHPWRDRKSGAIAPAVVERTQTR
jgi:hypothetical protein